MNMANQNLLSLNLMQIEAVATRLSMSPGVLQLCAAMATTLGLATGARCGSRAGGGE